MKTPALLAAAALAVLLLAGCGDGNRAAAPEPSPSAPATSADSDSDSDTTGMLVPKIGMNGKLGVGIDLGNGLTLSSSGVGFSY